MCVMLLYTSRFILINFLLASNFDSARLVAVWQWISKNDLPFLFLMRCAPVSHCVKGGGISAIIHFLIELILHYCVDMNTNSVLFILIFSPSKWKSWVFVVDIGYGVVIVTIARKHIITYRKRNTRINLR